ncbi:MAG TPA: ADP-ribose pyrophosphatase [Kosmotogaceae bacterium]|nr:MAG: NUDIX hydrolase [Thermotogales bacterium 46_20]HAA86008.1 ADP-ribose pyrophosphatase [Kosmotogaceae bacterium]
MEESIRNTRLFSGKIIDVEKHDVRLTDGTHSTREVVRHAGAAGVIPLDGKNVVLVKQYRFPIGEYLLEIPAGRLDPGEDPADCARRELLEETGYSIKEHKLMTLLYSSPGFTDERIYLYYAVVEKVAEPTPDTGEFLETVIVPLDEALEMVRSQRICDAKTISALLFYETLIRRRKSNDQS